MGQQPVLNPLIRNMLGDMQPPLCVAYLRLRGQRPYPSPLGLPPCPSPVAVDGSATHLAPQLLQPLPMCPLHRCTTLADCVLVTSLANLHICLRSLLPSLTGMCYLIARMQEVSHAGRCGHYSTTPAVGVGVCRPQHGACCQQGCALADTKDACIPWD